jgi:penicillin-binding protein 1A
VQRGTGAKVAAVGRPIAGKTGTTSDWTDAWFEGFTPDLAVGVFVGYDEPQSLGSGEQAAVVAAPIFRDFMIAALKDQPPTEFRIPPGVQMYRVSPTTGLPPGGGGEQAIWQAFKSGTDPNTNRDLGLHGVPGEFAAAVGGSTPDANDPNAQNPAALPMRDTPANGTGGLY